MLLSFNSILDVTLRNLKRIKPINTHSDVHFQRLFWLLGREQVITQQSRSRETRKEQNIFQIGDNRVWGQWGEGKVDRGWNRVYPEATPEGCESIIQVDNCAMVWICPLKSLVPRVAVWKGFGTFKRCVLSEVLGDEGHTLEGTERSHLSVPICLLALEGSHLL